MAYLVLFSGYFIVITYKNLATINRGLVSAHDEILEKYKNLAVFILKNKLPQNIDYFNAIANVTYDLSPVDEFKVEKIKADLVLDKQPLNNKINNITGCFITKCIRLKITEKKILENIARGELWQYGEINSIPLKSSLLVKISLNKFLLTYKDFITGILLGLFIWHLWQSLFFFIRNCKLSKNNTALLTISEKNKEELENLKLAYTKISDSTLLGQELISEYFTHYLHQLVTRNVFFEEIDLAAILTKIKNFFAYEIIKRELKIELIYDNVAMNIWSDKEIVFIILLNLIYRAIYRARIASKVTIKSSRLQNLLDITISDSGYEYKPKLADQINIYELPSPILEKLCQKLSIEISDSQKDEVNLISVKIMSSAINTRDNVIKFNARDKFT